MPDLVTRDELKAIIEIQSKNVEQLTVIANHLSTIVDRENKIYERLYNGLAKDISSAVMVHLEKLDETVDESRKEQVGMCAAASPLLKETLKAELDNCSMAKDIQHTKWFIGIVGLIIIVASVAINGIARKNEMSDIIGILKNNLAKSSEMQSESMLTHSHTGVTNAKSIQSV